MRRTAGYIIVLFMSGWFGPLGAALAADNLSISAFYGTWKGSGAANSPNNYFPMNARDLDVKIAPSGDGFNVTWTTITYPGGEDSLEKVKKKTTSVDFLPSGRPGVYRAARPGDPLSGEAYSWARIKGQTLSVYMLNVDDQGAYVIQSYDRTLTGFAMELTFARIRDDEPERTAIGKLVKTAN